MMRKKLIPLTVLLFLTSCQGFNVSRDNVFETTSSNGSTTTAALYEWNYSQWQNAVCVDSGHREQSRTANCADVQSGEVVDDEFCDVGSQEALTREIADSSCADEEIDWVYGPWTPAACISKSQRNETRTAVCNGAHPTSGAELCPPEVKTAATTGATLTPGVKRYSCGNSEEVYCGEHLREAIIRVANDSSCASVHGYWDYSDWNNGACTGVGVRAQSRVAQCKDSATQQNLPEIFCAGLAKLDLTRTFNDATCIDTVCNQVAGLVGAIDQKAPNFVLTTYSQSAVDTASFKITDMSNQNTYASGKTKMTLYGLSAPGSYSYYQFSNLVTTLQAAGVLTGSPGVPSYLYSPTLANVGGNSAVLMHLCTANTTPANCTPSSSAFLVSLKITNGSLGPVSGGTSSASDLNFVKKILTQVYLRDDSVNIGESCWIDFNETNSPLALDLKGHGIKTLDPLSTDTNFDLTGDGRAERISCFKNGAYLALPEREEIRDINQLFGNNTVGPDGNRSANGFEALAKWDRFNLDEGHKIIDQYDSVFSQLRLWDDIDCNGRVDTGELASLYDKKIKEIDLDYTHMYEQDQWGNETKQRSRFRFLDDRIGNIFDLWFASY